LTKRRKRRNNAKQNNAKQYNAKFGGNKYDSKMRDYVTSTQVEDKDKDKNKETVQTKVTSSFPSGAGPSMLSRELHTLR
jgi:predicted lipase